MLSWLSNNPDAAIAVLTLVGGWLGISKKKANLGALKDKLLARLRKAVLDMIEEHATIERARAMLHWAANELLEDLGVKRSKAVDAVVEPLIEQALKEYSERLGPLMLKARMDELFAVVAKLPKAFEVEDPTMPKLDLDIELVDEPTYRPNDPRAQKAAEIVRAKIAATPSGEGK